MLLFHNGLFSPELVPDPRVAEALRRALASAGGTPARCADILAAAAGLGDRRVSSLLARAMRPGHTPASLAGPAAPNAVRGGPVRRDAFAPDALAALGELEASLLATAGALAPAALEALLHFALVRLAADGTAPPGLDAARAASLFHDAVAASLAGVPAGDGPAARDAPADGPADADTPDEDGPPLPPGLAPSADLTRLARTSALPRELPFDGEPMYEAAFDGLARALHRRGGHALLVGERGVAKSAVIAELARRAASGAIPFLAGRRFVSVDCRHFPPDETRPRLAALMNRVGPDPALVACVDGFAGLLRGERGASNRPVLLSALASARCRLIGLVTPREYEEAVSDDPDLSELFSRVDVGEPGPDTALKLLRHYALGLGRKFSLSVDDEAVVQAVTLSSNYVLHDQLPAKALKVLNRACEEADYERAVRPPGPGRVTGDDAVRIVSGMTGVPTETLRGIAGRSDYAEGLREMVLGQEGAVREVAAELGLIKAGMTDPGKPASVMLFLGQTGTGKTEMAKALARLYSASKRLKTYTLGNCVEPHSVSTIIGVPPGYVGNEQGGRLINELNADPYGVFLLDEVDKAHPDVLQPLLNLFDEGWVSDQRGVRGYADKSIFIMTSNVGQRMLAEMAEQGKSAEEVRDRMKEVLSQIRHAKADRPVFTPEFLARIKRIIVFAPLGREAMLGIAAKVAAEACRSWAERRHKRLVLPDELVRRVGEEAHRVNERSKGKEGGRVVRKLFSEWVEAPLQREVSSRPEEYKACAAAEAALGGAGGEGPPEVTFRFLPA